MYHSGSTANHPPFADTYANSAARLAATGFERQAGGGIIPFDSEDVGKFARQTDDNSIWMLVDDSPITWLQVSGTGATSTEDVQDIVGAMLTDSATIDFTYDDGAGTETASVIDDSITNAKLTNMAQATIKGRASGAGTGDPTDLSGTQATAILDNVVGDSGSGGTKGLVPAPGAGDAAAGKYLDAAGGFSVPAGTGLSQEQVEDVVGAMLTDNDDLDWTYNDGAGTETATVKGTATALSPAVETLTDGATITWATAGKRINNAQVTLGGNRTLDITGEVDGATGTLVVIQDGTGSRTLTLPGSSKVINGGAGAVTLSTGANKIDILTWIFLGSTFYWTIGKDYS